MTDTTTESPLSGAQKERVAALKAAKTVLGNATLFSNTAPAERFDVTDILRVSTYIVTGRDLFEQEDDR